MPPRLLHRIAFEYLGEGGLRQRGDPVDHIGTLLGHDEPLIEAALAGLRSVPNRSDLPEVDEIIALTAENRPHFLALPLLAGLLEIERTSPETLSGLDENQLRKALAVRYCTPHVDVERRRWYHQLVCERPEMVAEVLVQCAASEIRHGKEHIHRWLRALMYEKDHAPVARHAILPLLRTFPIRCAERHLKALDHLLWAALWRRADYERFRMLITEKLSRRSMNIAQRVHWLAAGLVAAPDVWLDSLEEFVGDREERIRQVATFFCHDLNLVFSIPVPEPPTLILLIRLLGSWSAPHAGHRSGWGTLSHYASDYTHTLLEDLTALPGADIGNALEALQSDEALSAWRKELLYARNAQLRARNARRVIRRDAGYRHPSIKQIYRTLENGPPANAADLAALVVDRLDEIADRIRNGNIDDWRQYWNVDSHGRPQTPRPEDVCRDALLSDLRERLPTAVDAEPEGQYANDRRADIRIACEGFQVPVEIKKNNHRDLWRAPREQLIARYVREPATGGYGIYLVFWFGGRHSYCRNGYRPTTSPTGFRPSSPEELKQHLEQCLEATLSEAEARKISICVIDVSAP